jgi:hypothetical protein
MPAKWPAWRSMFLGTLLDQSNRMEQEKLRR